MNHLFITIIEFSGKFNKEFIRYHRIHPFPHKASENKNLKDTNLFEVSRLDNDKIESAGRFFSFKLFDSENLLL